MAYVLPLIVKTSTSSAPSSYVNPFTPSVSASVATMFVGSAANAGCKADKTSNKLEKTINAERDISFFKLIHLYVTN